MPASWSLAAFVSSSLLLTFHVRRKRKYEETFANKRIASNKTTSSTLLTKEQVTNLREKHFLKSVSVSYANSGPLMIVTVSRDYNIWSTHFYCEMILIILFPWIYLNPSPIFLSTGKRFAAGRRNWNVLPRHSEQRSSRRPWKCTCSPGSSNTASQAQYQHSVLAPQRCRIGETAL
jgi:hypothetical protein